MTCDVLVIGGGVVGCAILGPWRTTTCGWCCARSENDIGQGISRAKHRDRPHRLRRARSTRGGAPGDALARQVSGAVRPLGVDSCPAGAECSRSTRTTWRASTPTSARPPRTVSLSSGSRSRAVRATLALCQPEGARRPAHPWRGVGGLVRADSGIAESRRLPAMLLPTSRSPASSAATKAW